MTKLRDLAELKAIGSDRQYQEWVRHQPSCIDGNFDWDEAKGEPRCEPAHVRRAGESGTGYRGLFAVVPLTHKQHQLQHKCGELRLLCGAGIVQPGPNAVQEAADWFDTKRIEYVERWVNYKRGKV